MINIFLISPQFLIWNNGEIVGKMPYQYEKYRNYKIYDLLKFAALIMYGPEHKAQMFGLYRVP